MRTIGTIRRVRVFTRTDILAPNRDGEAVQPTGLEGRAILIVEDEPVIAMDVAQAFERAGAATAVTSTLHHALMLVEGENLSAAVLDHVLSDGDSSPLCRRLEERGLPFVVYSGLGKLEGPCALGAQVAKPEKPAVLVSMVAKLLQREGSKRCG